jgi:hypothetical protein
MATRGGAKPRVQPNIELQVRHYSTPATPA